MLIAVSCSKEEPASSDFGVRISASMSGKYTTKVPYEYTAPSPANPLNVEVWASTVKNIFLDRGWNGSGDDHAVAFHAKANFKSGEPQLLSDIIYSKDGTPIYFTGLYPLNDWNVSSDGTKASKTVDGKIDAMFAPQVSGAYGLKDESGESVWPVLHFYHLLTYLNVEMVADNETVANAWGNVLSIKLMNANDEQKLANQVNIDLSSSVNKSEDGFYNAAGVTFSGSTDFFKFYKKGTDIDFPSGAGYPLQYTPEVVAYSLITPVVTIAETNEFVIEIVTQRKTVTVPLNFFTADNEEFIGSTMGKQFDIQLFFNAGDNVMASAVCNEWKTGGIGTGVLDE